MKKILLFGINKKIHTIAKVAGELERGQFEYDFIKWGDLVFGPSGLKLKNEKIRINEYSAAFFDVPSYAIMKKNSKSEKDKTLIKLTGELYFTASILKDANISFINENIILKYPYYDKFFQSRIFFQNEIPAIPTIHLSDNKFEKVREVLENTDFKYPIVIKKSRGGMGLEVFKVNNVLELKSFLKDKRNWNLIYQPYIKNNCDFRVLVCGGKSLGVMKREAEAGEWKNNFALGGKVVAYQDKKMEKFAEGICRKIGFDFAGVDVIKSNGKYLILEVNMFPCFEGFEKVFPEAGVEKEVVKLLTC